MDSEQPTGADDDSEYSAPGESLAEALPQGFAGRSAGPGLLSNGDDDGLVHIADFVSIGLNTELVTQGDVLAQLYSDVPDLLRNPIVGQESVSVRLEYTGPRGTCVYGATHHTGPQGIVLRWGNLGDQRVPAAEIYSPQSGGPIVTDSRAGLMGWWKNSKIPGANLSENVYTATFHPPTDVSIPAMRVELDLWEYPVNQHGQCTSRMLATAVEHVTVDAELEADFVATVSTADPLEFGFESRASDPQQATADLSHAWDFGDGETSTAISPTHRFEAPGVYPVTLEVTNDRGQTDSLTRSVTVGAGLIVNSAGDAPAEDPAAGCDTGDTVGPDDEPECTLRAAIEAANAAGGGEITFNIAGAPVIAAGSALPKVTAPVTIDGTTQDGGWVEVAGNSTYGIVLAGPASTLSGLSVHGFEQAIRVESGEGHEITGVRVGLDRTGAATSDTVFGVAVTGGTATISDSESGAETGVAARAPVTVTDNRLGVDASGAPVPGAKVGVWIESAGGAVIDNTIYGGTIGVLLLGANAVEAQVTGNRIGTDGAAAFAGSGIGVSVQGAPGATITGNTIESASFAGVLVSGSDQTTEENDGVLVNSPLDDPTEASVTGGSATVRGNTIGSGDDDSGLAGVWAWAGAESITVEGNTVRAANDAGVILDGGNGHRVADNTLGSQSAPLDGSGIEADEVGEVVVEANSIYAHDAGVRAAGVAPSVTGNTVTGVGADAIGISITAERDGVAVDDNTVRQAASSGILVDGPRIEVRNNTIVQSGIGITTSGEGIVLRENLIGVEPANGALLGNTGHGVQVYSGSIDASRNVIAGSGGNGVDVAPGAMAKLTANRIWESTGKAIANPDGPETPGIAAAIIADTDGSPLTTILIDGLAEGETGTIEVFANDTAAGGQAQHVLDATRSIGAHETVRIVQLASGRDHFTVTFTDSSGNTSELSEVGSRQGFPDSDGDGAVDPIDGILGLEQDPTVAILATRNEQLLLARVTPYDLEEDFGGGRFEDLRVVDDPTPGAHPEGWSLPYGALAFRISDLPYGGARTSVMFASFYGDDPLLGNAYWKYGPQATGGASGWYEFTWDETTQTGGTVSVADLGPLGFRTAHVLTFEDGARGDSDGGMNRSITDPGGPVIYTAGNGHSGNTGDAGPAQAAPSSLTTTGSDSETMQLMLGIAFLLAAIGASLLLLGGGRHSLSRSGR
ncbi:MAG: right-handed parallel beta-helix repeat-containing protein [Leucobacter sp.]